MNLDLLIPLLITAAVTIFGWFIAHWLSTRRDRANKLRDLRIQYLIEAWRRLANAANRKDTLTISHESLINDLESATTDIQLFGSSRQIELVQKLANEVGNTGTASLDEILNDLRQELRASLSLPTAPEDIVWLRFSPSRQRQKETRK